MPEPPDAVRHALRLARMNEPHFLTDDTCQQSNPDTGTLVGDGGLGQDILAGRFVWGWVGRRPELFRTDQAGTAAKSDVYRKVEERPNTRFFHDPLPDTPP